jgi:sugar lactone lactonase YvrE
VLKTSAALLLGLTLIILSAIGASSAPTAGKLLASGLEGTIGGTIGPDGAVYVPEGATGEITRIDPATGATSTFASGLPPAPFGGAIDVAFVGDTAYALVTLVEVSGIYRMDGPSSFTVIADIGAFSASNLPPYPVDVPIGLQYQLQPISGGFLVSDGHHNRILRVTMDGEVSKLISFGNIVPTGLAVSGSTVYMTESGPIPHAPQDGRVSSFSLNDPETHDLASGFSLVVDVELGPGGAIYAISQGNSPGEVPPASPAQPDSGKLLRVNDNGTFTVLVDGLDLPTSLDFSGDTAFIVTLNGEVWKVDGVSGLKGGASATTISPPSTGDGGLAGRSGNQTALLVTAGVAVVALVLTGRRRFLRS